MSYNDGTDERLLKLFHAIYTFLLLTLIVSSVIELWYKPWMLEKCLKRL